MTAPGAGADFDNREMLIYLSEGMPEKLRAAAASVAARHALRPDWINDAAKVGLPRLDANVEPVHSGERLIVYRTDSKYLLATKLHAGRPRTSTTRCRWRSLRASRPAMRCTTLSWRPSRPRC